MNGANDFGRRLRQLRRGNGLTQEQLRKGLEDQGYDISHIGTISRWEGGSRIPKAEIVEALEDILGVNRGVLLRAARYVLEPSQDGTVSPENGDLKTIQRTYHITEVCDTAESLLADGLHSASCSGWTANQSDQGKYVIPNENVESGYEGLTKEQLASRLDSNIASVLKKKDWFFRNCFIPHLKSELPQELKTKLFFKVVEEQPYELIEILRMLAAKRTFKGTCPVCEDW